MLEGMRTGEADLAGVEMSSTRGGEEGGEHGSGGECEAHRGEVYDIYTGEVKTEKLGGLKLGSLKAKGRRANERKK